MSLRFYFGPSGSGKSHRIYEEIMQRAAEEPGRNFLIIVPDQFTMQTQKDLVMRSDRDGILNIDVLSFGRLSHRILEEVGTKEMPVLDDTGKSLVLQKIAADLKEQLPAMGSLLHKQGYIHEVKSAISEFMQYGISTQDMDKLIASAEKRGALAMKLRDLRPHIAADTITLLDRLWKKPGNWMVAPQSVILELSHYRPLFISELKNTPPNRVCYKIKHKYPKSTSKRAVEFFENALEDFLAESTPSFPIGQVWERQK